MEAQSLDKKWVVPFVATLFGMMALQISSWVLRLCFRTFKTRSACPILKWDFSREFTDCWQSF